MPQLNITPRRCMASRALEKREYIGFLEHLIESQTNWLAYPCIHFHLCGFPPLISAEMVAEHELGVRAGIRVVVWQMQRQWLKQASTAKTEGVELEENNQSKYEGQEPATAHEACG